MPKRLPKRGKLVFRTAYAIADLEAKLGGLPGVEMWTETGAGGFALEHQTGDGYRLEGRLIVDWNGDGKGPQRTGYRRLLLSI